jgi:hypothetical protein
MWGGSRKKSRGPELVPPTQPLSEVSWLIAAAGWEGPSHRCRSRDMLWDGFAMWLWRSYRR